MSILIPAINIKDSTYTASDSYNYLKSCKFSTLVANQNMQIEITGNFYNPTTTSLSARIYKKIYTDSTISDAQPEKIFANFNDISNTTENNMILKSADINVLAPGTYYLYTYLSYTFGLEYKYFSKSYVQFVIQDTNVYPTLNSIISSTGTSTVVTTLSDFLLAIQNKYTIINILTFLSSLVNAYANSTKLPDYYSLIDIANIDEYIKGLPADTDAILKNTLTDMQAVIKLQFNNAYEAAAVRAQQALKDVLGQTISSISTMASTIMKIIDKKT
jgi:hypothetical protein